VKEDEQLAAIQLSFANEYCASKEKVESDEDSPFSETSSEGGDDAGTKQCANCGSVETHEIALSACSRCKQVFYCGRACQAEHWKLAPGGHKEVCAYPVSAGRNAVSPPSASQTTPKRAAAPPPADLVCPLTEALFLDPVVAADGVCYERAAIKLWIRDKQGGTGRVMSPAGHCPLEHLILTQVRAMKRMADEWRTR
jgi:hypothetical protein